MTPVILDALLFNQPDSAFYQKTLAIEQISFDVLASAEKPGIWLAGPEQWSPEKTPSLPLALVWKTSSQANGGVQPSTHGHIVLSHESGGRTVMAKLVDEDKLPPPQREDEATRKPDKPARERLIAGELWWDADANLFGGLPGGWTAAVISGGWVSNAHRVMVEVPSFKDTVVQAKLSDRTFTAEELAAYAKTSRHPALPEKGVQFKLGLSEGSKRKPMLFGAYALPAPTASPEADPGADLVLNAFLSGLGFKDVLQWKIVLPAAAAKTEAGIRKGWFLLDLEQRLRNPRLETFEFPADTYITFVYGSWFSKPEPLDPGSMR